MKRIFVGLIVAGILSACGVTARMEPYKQTSSVIGDGEQVVILARKHHATHETESDFIDCISDGLSDALYLALEFLAICK